MASALPILCLSHTYSSSGKSKQLCCRSADKFGFGSKKYLKKGRIKTFCPLKLKGFFLKNAQRDTKLKVKTFFLKLQIFMKITCSI